jgi:hypothetical protein
MQLIFERGDRDAPVGHALIYFRADDSTILATYISVPPIHFDLSNYVPPFLKEATQGMGLSLGMGMGEQIIATPMPPIPEEVPSVEYLRALAERRKDDLIFAGGAMRSDAMRLAAETAEAAREYGEMYGAGAPPEPEFVEHAVPPEADSARYQDLTEQERLNELTTLTGRLRDSLRDGSADPAIGRQMEALAQQLPPKYRARDLIRAAQIPGERGQKLAELYLERSYKLFREDYLDLERIDHEIETS